ncbi:hypothetical protein [Mucilaginibacter sp.]
MDKQRFNEAKLQVGMDVEKKSKKEILFRNQDDSAMLIYEISGKKKQVKNPDSYS